MKPKLFLLRMPFEDEPGKLWFCTHCALIEGALAVNSHWADHIEIHRIDFPKPRQALVELLGEDKQWLPVLALANGDILEKPIEITNYLAQEFGGAAPHP